MANLLGAFYCTRLAVCLRLKLPTLGQVALMGYTGNNIGAGPCSGDPNENRNERTHGHTLPPAHTHRRIYFLLRPQGNLIIEYGSFAATL